MRHDDAAMFAGGGEKLRAGDLGALVVQLRGGEAVGGDAGGGEAERGAFEGGVGAPGCVEVWRVTDAHGAVLVAPDGVGCGCGSDVEVLDF